jgi:hypothetical protein
LVAARGGFWHDWRRARRRSALRSRAGRMKMAKSRGIVVVAESQSCYAIATSPACGRGHDVNEMATFRVVPARLSSPLPGLRARPLPQGEVTLVSPGAGSSGAKCHGELRLLGLGEATGVAVVRLPQAPCSQGVRRS